MNMGKIKIMVTGINLDLLKKSGCLRYEETQTSEVDACDRYNMQFRKVRKANTNALNYWNKERLLLVTVKCIFLYSDIIKTTVCKSNCNKIWYSRVQEEGYPSLSNVYKSSLITDGKCPLNMLVFQHYFLTDSPVFIINFTYEGPSIIS